MYWLIVVPNEVSRLGIAAGSEFQLPAIKLPESCTFDDYVRNEIGLYHDEFIRI